MTTCMVKMRLLSVVLTLTAASFLHGEGPQPQSSLSDPEKATLMEQANSLQEAFTNGDADLIIRKTHPSIFQMFKSREQFETITREAVKNLPAKITIEKTDWGQPTGLYANGDEDVCFVPKTMTMKLGAKHLQSVGYLVAVRQHGAKDWLFIDGAGMKGNPALLYTLLPKLPRDIITPPNVITMLP